MITSQNQPNQKQPYTFLIGFFIISHFLGFFYILYDLFFDPNVTRLEISMLLSAVVRITFLILLLLRKKEFYYFYYIDVALRVYLYAFTIDLYSYLGIPLPSSDIPSGISSLTLFWLFFVVFSSTLKRFVNFPSVQYIPQPNTFIPPEAPSAPIAPNAFINGISSPPSSTQINNQSQNKRYCPYCGNQIDPNRFKCTACGKKIRLFPKPTKTAVLITIITVLCLAIVGLGFWAASLKQKADFLTHEIGFVIKGDTKYYHTYDCEKFRNITVYWAYDIPELRNSTYKPCPLCYTLKQP